MISNVIWIDSNIDNEENTSYAKELESLGSLRLRLFKEVNKAVIYMKYIEFQETKVIISDYFFSEFVKKFKENILDMSIAPKIIVFTKDKDKFIKDNKDYKNINNIFYASGGITTSFEKVKKFLKSENKMEKSNKSENIQLTFDYINNIDKLILPMFFKSLIDHQSTNNMEIYTNFLYETYSKETELKELLNPIE